MNSLFLIQIFPYYYGDYVAGFLLTRKTMFMYNMDVIEKYHYRIGFFTYVEDSGK